MGEKKGFFARLAQGLGKTREAVSASLSAVFSGSERIDEDFYDDLEETLIGADIGVSLTEQILSDLRQKVKEEHIKAPADCKKVLLESTKEQMRIPREEETKISYPAVVLVVGVNGVGKTTSIGKLACRCQKQGKKVLLAGADTFRAAAGEQLRVWAECIGADMVGGTEGADPASVVYDAVSAAKARKADVLFVDTAGRLHNKKNLMNELGKMHRILDQNFAEASRGTLLVLDATTGQNALVQAREFSKVTPLCGIILTKMDSTAKGGIALAVAKELSVPVLYIGIGEGEEDLQPFDADAFVDAIFAE